MFCNPNSTQTHAREMIILSLFRLCLTCLIATLLASCASPGIEPAAVEEGTPSSEASTPSAMSELDKSQYLQAIDYLNQNQPAAAESILTKLARKYPQNLEINVNLATTFYKSGEFKRAKKAITKTQSREDTLPEVHNLLGLLAVENREFSQAEAQYQTALKLDKRFAIAHYNLALLYDIYFQDIPRAYSHYMEYLTLVPDDEQTKDWVDQLRYSLDQE